MQKRIFTLYGLSAVIYLALIMVTSSPWLTFLKVVPILSMGWLLFQTTEELMQKLVTAAFIFSAAGDVILSLDRQNLFVFGLGSFLVAQLLFAVAFLQRRRWYPRRNVLVVIVVLFVVFMLNQLWPLLGELRIAVTVYISAIAFMALSSLTFPSPWAFAGAFFFVASDSLIAWNKFVEPVAHSRVLIMSTYYAAQFMIGYGIWYHEHHIYPDTKQS